MPSRSILMTCALALTLAVLPAVAQGPQDQQPLSATALRVSGRAYQAPVDAAAIDVNAWKPISQGDELPAGTQVRVSIRSTLLLQYGDDTIIQLKSMTLASLDELYRTETSKHSKLGLAYGAIRASVREKELRSDMRIEAPTLTCSKEGTENFELRVQRGSFYWHARGPSIGTILVRDVGTGRSERLSFSQLVNFFNLTTPAVQRTLAQQIVGQYGARFVSSGEQNFNMFVDSGQAVTGPGLGSQGFSVIPGGQEDVMDGVSIDPRLITQQDVALLFRQVESRFGAGPLPHARQIRAWARPGNFWRRR